MHITNIHICIIICSLFTGICSMWCLSYLEYKRSIEGLIVVKLCCEHQNSTHTLTMNHYSDATMSAMASQITSPTIVHSDIYSGTNQRKHQNSTSLVFVWRIHQWPVNSLPKWPVTRKMFPFDDVSMDSGGRLNKKDGLTRYGDSHVKDKTS